MKKLLFSALSVFLFSGNLFAQFSADLAGFPLVTTGWTIGGTATVVDSTVQLTPPSTGQSGYVYYSTPSNLTGCGQFTVDFDYRVVPSPASTIADGIAFWYISNPPSGFSVGGGIGLPSFPNGLVMIMDTYDNISPDFVPLGVLLGYDGTVAGYTEGSPAGLLAPVVHSLSFITDGTWRHCKITYNVGTINVFFNYSTTPTLTGFYPLTITGYFGFSSSTGAAYSTQSVKNIHITAVTSLDPPTVVSPVTYCQDDVASPLTATGAVGSSFPWYTTDTGLVVSLPSAPTPNTSTPGTTWYFVRQTSGTCVSPPDSIEVIVNPKPVPPVISGQKVYCQDATFSPFTVSGTSVLWYTTVTGGTGSATAPSVPTPTPGVYTYYATQTVSGCESNRASITVTVNPTSATPVLTAGNLIYCQYEPFVPFAVTGTNVLWYTAATGGTGIPTAPTVNTNIPATHDYYVTQTDELGCESQRLHLHIIVYAKPAVPGVTPVEYCQYQPPIPLFATGTSLLWYGPGVTAASGTPPTPSTAITGLDSFYVTQTVNGCVSDSSLITVKIDSTPVAPTASSNTPVCQGDTLFMFSFTPTAGVTYNWAGPGYSSASQNPLVMNALPSATGFYTVTAALGACTSSAVISVSVTPTPPLLISSNSPVCTGIPDTIFLYATSGAGAEYSWIGPHNFASGAQNPYITPVLSDYGGVYTASVLLNGCTTTVTINVEVRETPPTPWVKWLTYCQDYDAPPLQAIGSNLLWYMTDDVTGGGTSTPPKPSTATTGWKFYYVNQTVAGCPGPVDSIKVQVNPRPTVKANIAAEVCPRDSVLLSAADEDPIVYYHWLPSMYLRDTATATVTAWPETDITYSVVTTNQYGCTDTATVPVTVRAAAVITLPDSVTIYPDETYQLDPQSNCSSFRWTPAGGLSNANISNPVAAPESSTRYYVTAVTEWGCKTKDTIDVMVNTEAVLAVPNAFAPGSGPNNVFKVIKRGMATLRTFRIYDRWGVVVFETKNIDQGWDGTYKGVPQPMGVYVYEIQAETAASGKLFSKNGNLTLLR